MYWIPLYLINVVKHKFGFSSTVEVILKSDIWQMSIYELRNKGVIKRRRLTRDLTYNHPKCKLMII